MNMTKHASIRAQQRGIPPLIDLWLDQYGEEVYQDNGSIIRLFNRSSIRSMERDFGRRPIKKLSEFFSAYKVVSSHDDRTITVGHRTKRINHK